MLTRSLFDFSVFNPQGLIYSARPRLGNGVCQLPRELVIIHGDKNFLGFNIESLPGVSADQLVLAEAAREEAKEKKRPEFEALKEKKVQEIRDGRNLPAKGL